MKMKQYKDIDEFIANFPPDIQKILKEFRKVIHEEAPEAKEKIAYGIPTFTFHGNLVHFSAYEKHIGLYPTSSPIRVFANELKKYETAKGTIRFPIDKPLPWHLIRKIIRFRVEENKNRKK